MCSSDLDADCVRSWCKNLSGDAKRRFARECPHTEGQSRAYDLIELALRSRGNLVVVPMQDYLELTNEQGRMNTPAVADGNWNWRLSKRYRTKALTERIAEIIKRTKRTDK